MSSDECVGYGRQKRVCPGSQSDSRQRKLKSIITLVLVILLMSLLTMSLATPVSAQDESTITIGQDKVFTECNYRNSWFDGWLQNPQTFVEYTINATDNEGLVVTSVSPDLLIKVKAPRTVLINEPFEVVLEVKNDFDVSVTNIKINVTFPSSPDVTGEPINFIIPSLAPGENHTTSWVVSIPDEGHQYGWISVSHDPVCTGTICRLGSLKQWDFNVKSPVIFHFDTGSSSNPYPSISGTHTGTITPNQTITASKLYTYPCAGTGGHTEYAKIGNDSWRIETLPWEGHKGDWHNLSFAESFKLYANETYDYTIRTGSYPQIHYTNALPTANGWINCTEFVDANGRVYNDWIPAIRLFVGKSSASGWYVDDDGGADFTRLEDAISVASAGDTIIVRDGTYTENVDVYKRLTIRSENGSASTIIRAASTSNHVFDVTTDYVNISGFTVENATERYKAGIYLGGSADHCSISDNNATNNYYGIYMRYSSNGNLTNNYAPNNKENGIYLQNSNNNSISNNSCSNNNGGDGIYFWNSNNNKLTGNTMFGNGIYISGSSQSDYYQEMDTSNTVNGKPVYYWKDVMGGRVPDGAGQVILVNCSNVIVETQDLCDASAGIEVAFSSNITIKNNNCSSNSRCNICLCNSFNNTIINNIVSNAYNDGIYLKESRYNTITGNNVISNNYGVYLSPYSDNNTITGNNIIGNNNYGILFLTANVCPLQGNIPCFTTPRNNLIYNNYFDNMNNTRDGGDNIWNVTKTAGTNIIGGPYLGGNYWSDYNGGDYDKDGLGDRPLPYNSYGNIKNGGDYLPLVKAVASSVFDTCSGTSMMGIHNGTIKSSDDISVSKKYDDWNTRD